MNGETGSRGRPGSGSGGRRWRLVRADADAVPASVRPRAGRRLTRRHLVLRWAALLTGVAVIVGSTWLVYGTDVFAVVKVRVTGLRVLDADQVRDAAAVRTGTPLARLDLDRIGRRVAELPAVAKVAVERDWPDAVVIRVTERTPVAAVPSQGRFVVVDGAGVVFDEAAERPAELPLLDVARPGPRDETTRDALRVLASLTPQIRAVLVRLRADSPTRITLRLTGGRSVIWGDATHNDKKAQVVTVLLRRDVRVIDVSAPDVVTTR